MNAMAILGVSMTLSLIAWILISRIWILPALKYRTRNEALIALTIPHLFRFIGLSFLLHGVTAAPLDPRFANPAAYGDLLAALLALIAIVLLLNNSRLATVAVWIFNVTGFIDLLNAVSRGLRFNDPAAMGATYFIPTLAVPILMVTHIMIFQRLLKPGPTSTASAENLPR